MGSAVAMALLNSPKEPALEKLVIVDPDHIELSNLHRQLIYTMDDLGSAKADRAADYIDKERPEFKAQPFIQRLDGVEEIAAKADGCGLIIDGSDNYATRFAANDAALQLGIPLIHGAAIGYNGQLMTVIPGHSACLRCLFYGPPATREANCRSEGVIGALVGEVGWLMAIEAVKILWGEGVPLTDRLLTIDSNRQRRHTTHFNRRTGCTGCG
ncbi:MAG: HesA/MoeB/ThiF family protein [Magnetococcales bacterium]|nr:HesA/MoeB/ThiF family protein [Magnetococcales bacterium]